MHIHSIVFAKCTSRQTIHFDDAPFFTLNKTSIENSTTRGDPSGRSVQRFVQTSIRKNRRPNEKTDVQTKKQTSKRKNRRPNKKTDVQTKKQTSKPKNGKRKDKEQENENGDGNENKDGNGKEPQTPR